MSGKVKGLRKDLLLYKAFGKVIEFSWGGWCRIQIVIKFRSA